MGLCGGPFLRRRSILPDWVPGSMVALARPSRVGTITLPPSMAVLRSSKVVYDVATVRLRCPSGRSSCTNRSPLGPPLGPTLPLPRRVICIPDAAHSWYLYLYYLFYFHSSMTVLPQALIITPFGPCRGRWGRWFGVQLTLPICLSCVHV